MWKKCEEKQLYGYFKRQNWRDCSQAWTWLRIGHLKRELESLLITAQNETIRTNYVKARTHRIGSVCYVEKDMRLSHNQWMQETKRIQN